MKVTIKYEFDRGDIYPYVAKGFDKNGYITLKVSDTSFKEAKEKLITALKLIYEEPKSKLPEPEEIEI